MGVDARIAVKFDPAPSHVRVKELQFHLMHRFGHEMFWTKSWKAKDEWEVKDFIVPIIEGECYFDSDFDATGLWFVSLYSRYYGEGYERGPGLELAGIVYFLASQPDVIEVRYGGDSSGTHGEVYDQKKALELFEKFCRDGQLPYQAYFDTARDRKGETRPDCSYCELPMIRNGYGGSYAAFYCAGCGESLTLRDEEFKKWSDGLAYVGERESTIKA